MSVGTTSSYSPPPIAVAVGNPVGTSGAGVGSGSGPPLFEVGAFDTVPASPLKERKFGSVLIPGSAGTLGALDLTDFGATPPV